MDISEDEVKKFLADYKKLRAAIRAAYKEFGPNELARILEMSPGTISNWHSKDWPLKPETLARHLTTLLRHEKKSRGRQ